MRRSAASPLHYHAFDPGVFVARLAVPCSSLFKKLSTLCFDLSFSDIEVSFFDTFKQGIVSLTDEEFARLERIIMERRGRAAAHVLLRQLE